MGLRFFKPEFFSALLFLGVVLLIHLFRRPKTVTLNFSTLQFFNVDSTKKTKARTLRRLLLLLTRCALITLIVFLFAGPYFPSTTMGNFSNPDISLFVWVDHSPSMDYSDGTSTIGEHAIVLIDSIAKHLPVSGTLYFFDYTMNDFRVYERGATYFESRHGPLNLDKVLQKAISHPNYSPHSMLLLMSDYQKATTDAIDSLMNRIEIKPNTICISMSPDSPWNFSINKVALASGAAIEVEIDASGHALQSGKVGLISGNVHSVPINVSIEKDSSVKVMVPIVGQENGTYRIQLDENDPLRFDNVRTVSIESQVSEAVAILGNVEDNFVIAAALKASGDDFWNTVYLRDCSSISDEEIGRSSLIIVNNAGDPCPILEKIISSPGSRNKSIFYCMGTDSSSSAFNDRTILKSVIPSFIYANTQKLSGSVYPVLPDTLSGLWYGFTGKHEQMVEITSYIRKIPGTPLCYLSDGGILLSMLTDTRGLRWIFSSTPIGRNAPNNLWESGIYVPMLDRIGRFARSRVLMGTTIVAGYPVRNPLFNSRKSGFIYDPEGKQYPVVDNPHIIFKKPGIYKVVIQGESVQNISVSADTSESRLIYREPSTSNLPIGNLVVYTPSELLLKINGSGDPYSYIPWLLLALIIIIEILLWEKKLLPGLKVEK